MIVLSVIAASVAIPSSYAGCPGVDGLRDAFSVESVPVKSELVDHQQLRASLGANVPDGRRRILLWGTGGDLATRHTSLIAVRGRHGLWKIDMVSESTIWVTGAKPTIDPPVRRDLDRATSAALDRALQDKCLAAAPSSIYYNRIGALYWTLEVESPKRQLRLTWRGPAIPQVDTVVRLIAPH